MWAYAPEGPLQADRSSCKPASMSGGGAQFTRIASGASVSSAWQARAIVSPLNSLPDWSGTNAIQYGTPTLRAALDESTIRVWSRRRRPRRDLLPQPGRTLPARDAL